jgi:hypothetical protein
VLLILHSECSAICCMGKYGNLADQTGFVCCCAFHRAGNDHVYMPAAADAGPASFMRWLKEYGQGGPPVTKLKEPYVGHTPPGGC